MENKKNIRVISSLRGVCAQLHDSRGASIIIALAMIAAIMFFTIGMASTMIMAIQNTSDSKKALQAEYAAQSGVELANFFLKDKEVGSDASVNETGKCLDSDVSDGEENCLSKVQYTIEGKDENGLYTDPDGYRTIPIKGTGNAGDCSDSSNINDDCNWNKLYYGDSIEVPFYVGDINTNLNKFYFKVRTPNGEAIAASNDIVFSWQLMGESCENTSCVCVPENGGISSADINDHISEGSVGAVFNFFWMLCIDSTDDAEDPADYDLDNFLKDDYDGTFITKQKIKISYVKALKGDTGDIPYLEYQFAYEGGPLAAVYKVNITGISNNFKFSLNGVQGLGAGLFDFAVQN